MKKFLALALVGAMAFTLAACSSNGDASADNGKNIEGTLTEIMEKVTDVPSLEIMTMDQELTAENFEYNTKITMPEGAEGLASDAAMNAQAHSVVLIRLAEGSDGDKIAEEILTKHTDGSPSKWICVGPEKVEVVRHGDLILFVQSWEDTAKEVVEKFNELAK